MEQIVIGIVGALVALVLLAAIGWGLERRVLSSEPPRICAENGEALGRCRHSMHCYVAGAGYVPCELSTPVRGFNGGAGLSFCQHGRRVWVC